MFTAHKGSQFYFFFLLNRIKKKKIQICLRQNEIMQRKSNVYIRKTCNIYLLEPHFYIAKMGYAEAG